MKAEINGDGLLVIIHESQKELEILKKWVKKNKGKISIPKTRTELATVNFDVIKVVVCNGLSWDRWGIAIEGRDK